jgi:hypothetical protein
VPQHRAPAEPARPPLRMGRTDSTATLYFVAMFSILAGDTGWWIGVIFGAATMSGIYLMITMYHFFKAG